MSVSKTSRRAGRLGWVIDRLQGEPSFVRKSMFGCDACYLHGRLVLVLAMRKEEPWRGILVPTEKEFHHALVLLHEGLRRHSVLGKWLYLPLSCEHFEETALALAERVIADDHRVGVMPGAGRKPV